MESRSLSDWLEVRGQEFTPDEARQASDFYDTMSNYNVEPEELKDFLEEQIKVGHRLCLAELMPIDDIGVLLFGEEDDRIIKVAKDRCGITNEEEDMQGGIYLGSSTKPSGGGGIILN